MNDSGFHIERAEAADYQIFADIIQEVWGAMDHKDWYAADNADYTYRMLTTGEGTGYKAVEDATGQIAGIFLVTFPGLSEMNMGRDAGLLEEELPAVAHMDSAAVLPRFRGHQLQYRLMQTAEQDLRSMGYRYLMCTIHPDNVYSLSNVLRQGYRVVGQKLKHGGYPRAILLKKLE